MYSIYSYTNTNLLFIYIFIYENNSLEIRAFIILLVIIWPIIKYNIKSIFNISIFNIFYITI